MDGKLLISFLLIELLESGYGHEVQSLYKVYQGYTALNAKLVDSMFVPYQSSIRCMLRCTQSPDCMAIGYENVPDGKGIHCKMISLVPGYITYLKADSSYVYVQDTMSKVIE